MEFKKLLSNAYFSFICYFFEKECMCVCVLKESQWTNAHTIGATRAATLPLAMKSWKSSFLLSSHINLIVIHFRVDTGKGSVKAFAL